MIRLPMNRDDTAAYVGANRSALSRELARMKEDHPELFAGCAREEAGKLWPLLPDIHCIH